MMVLLVHMMVNDDGGRDDMTDADGGGDVDDGYGGEQRWC
jgi:hypothetical protein